MGALRKHTCVVSVQLALHAVDELSRIEAFLTDHS